MLGLEAGSQMLSLSLGHGSLQGSPPSPVPAGCPGVDPRLCRSLEGGGNNQRLHGRRCPSPSPPGRWLGKAGAVRLSRSLRCLPRRGASPDGRCFTSAPPKQPELLSRVWRGSDVAWMSPSWGLSRSPDHWGCVWLTTPCVPCLPGGVVLAACSCLTSQKASGSARRAGWAAIPGD